MSQITQVPDGSSEMHSAAFIGFLYLHNVVQSMECIGGQMAFAPLAIHSDEGKYSLPTCLLSFMLMIADTSMYLNNPVNLH